MRGKSGLRTSYLTKWIQEIAERLLALNSQLKSFECRTLTILLYPFLNVMSFPMHCHIFQLNLYLWLFNCTSNILMSGEIPEIYYQGLYKSLNYCFENLLDFLFYWLHDFVFLQGYWHPPFGCYSFRFMYYFYYLQCLNCLCSFGNALTAFHTYQYNFSRKLSHSVI